jgi:NAD(P)-dependent dehydrogenase (short-subunit alcohol dehydrogenase family)
MRVLITGTSTGIGMATAVELGRAGHTVFATMRNPTRAPELGELVAKERLPVSILTMDVDSDQSVDGVVEELHGRGGAIDVLINNAGIERNGSIEELPMEAFRSVMETNYFGSLRCIHAVVPQMREKRSGCIITSHRLLAGSHSPLWARTLLRSGPWKL